LEGLIGRRQVCSHQQFFERLASIFGRMILLEGPFHFHLLWSKTVISLVMLSHLMMQAVCGIYTGLTTSYSKI